MANKPEELYLHPVQSPHFREAALFKPMKTVRVSLHADNEGLTKDFIVEAAVKNRSSLELEVSKQN